jgi:hypothetical protein
MGCWAIDAFGNDDAADWAYGLEECNDLSLIESTLDKVLAVTSEEYLEAPYASEALAAIEVIARLQGHWGERNAYTETVDSWVEKTKLKPSQALMQKAYRTIERILSDQSELRELWEESEEFDAWRASVEELKSRVHAQS